MGKAGLKNKGAFLKAAKQGFLSPSPPHTPWAGFSIRKVHSALHKLECTLDQTDKSTLIRILAFIKTPPALKGGFKYVFLLSCLQQPHKVGLPKCMKMRVDCQRLVSKLKARFEP